MKKKDLVVGKEYLSNGKQDWTIGLYDATRVRILDLDVSVWRWKDGKLEKTTFSTGLTGLRVEVLDKNTGEVKGIGVVTLASLRGEWAPTYGRVKKNHEDRIAAQEAASARKNAARDRVGILMAKVKSFLGLTSDYETMKMVQDVYKETKVLVDIDFLNAMITELDKQGWTYKP